MFLLVNKEKWQLVECCEDEKDHNCESILQTTKFYDDDFGHVDNDDKLLYLNV